MVGPCGLEPQTSTVSRWRSSQLSYGPTDLFRILAQGLAASSGQSFLDSLPVTSWRALHISQGCLAYLVGSVTANPMSKRDRWENGK
jgi:hypothetical protein